MSKRLINNGGFTIIETLIVLAIAGIIMLIVFAAIPALNRSSRNNQRRQDINSILQAVSHFQLNNSGSMPDTSFSLASDHLTYYDGSTINLCPSALHTGVNIYSYANYFHSSGCAHVPSASLTSVDTVAILNYAKCDTSSPGAFTIHGAGFGDVVALFAVETGSGSEPQCQQL